MRAVVSNLVKRCILSSVVRYSGSRAGSHVAITFDDGPHPEVTPHVLAALREADQKATFFLLGTQAEKHPELVREILAGGHEIGNHTHTHQRAWRVTARRMAEEIEAADRAIRSAGADRIPYFRPPGGELSPGLLLYLSRTRRAAPVLWSRLIVREDRRSRDEILAELRARPLRPGDILLLHDDSPETAAALPELLRDLEAGGLRSVTLSELLRRRG